MNIEEGDIVLCTVDRIIGTTVFVHIEKNGGGSIVFSEIAPGRIRNIRDYVVPKKKIVCKILRIKGDGIELSLRRVTQKEKKEILNHYSQEASYIKMINSILGEKAKKIIDKIEKKSYVYDFLQEAKSNPEVLESAFPKDASKKIMEILESQKPKQIALKKEIFLASANSEGLNDVKEILGNLGDIEVKYISAAQALKKWR